MGPDELKLLVGAKGSLITNDRYDGALVSAGGVKVTLITTTLPGAELSTAGQLKVPPRTEAKTYLLAYQICLTSAPTDCGTGTARVTVTVPSIVFPLDGQTVDQFQNSQSPATQPGSCGTGNATGGTTITIGCASVQIGGPVTIATPGTQPWWNDPSQPRGAYDIPKSELAVMFNDFYPMTGPAATAINAANYWRQVLDSYDLMHPFESAAQRAQMKAELKRVIALYEQQTADEYNKSQDQFWSAMTQPPSRETQAEVDRLTRQINDLMVSIRREESSNKAVSVLLDAVTLGTAGLLIDTASEIGNAVKAGELAKLLDQRSKIDGSAQRGVIAASLTNRVMNLLDRGAPYTEGETALIGQIEAMVQRSAVQVAEANERLFNNWMADQLELRRIQGVNLAILYDTGTPVPNFFNEALAAAGLGPGGAGTGASISLFGAKAVVPALAHYADAVGATAKLKEAIYPYWSVSQGPKQLGEIVLDEAPKAVVKWKAAQPAAREGTKALQAIDVGVDAAGEAMQAARIARETASAAAAGADSFKMASAATDIAKAAAEGAELAAKGASAAKGLKAVGAALKAAGPIADVASVALGVAIAAGQAADAWDNGAKRLSEAVTKARETPIGMWDIQKMTATVDGRAQLIAILAGQLGQRSSTPGPVASPFKFLNKP